MSVIPLQHHHPLDAAEPAWEVAQLFPAQGEWSEADYLLLPGNRLVEFCDGRIEVLPMPTVLHQMIVAYLYRELHRFVAERDLGLVLFAALPVRLRKGKYREPDVLYMSKSHLDRVSEQYWDGADLVIEVVSENDPKRDLETKREEYAAAGIEEYWIVEPKNHRVTVLALKNDQYVQQGQYRSGEQAESALLAGFKVAVDQIFARTIG